ncbi:NADP-dependent 3-hydroxy acid dehydrogenase YdfG [Arcticibacter tournemirensis]|uniref:SDR family oxidoreductase n=1 Tax=Arcticibacter tournemirensis TaxID=699437 RepID=A0A5M9HDH8_9SPHI|nr:SDR family oxidoreductase [Arcticibacter tournemirensis]KAA8484385.1 SDR family oxidoreductase [Arcticibacter tournemirensis]TQM49827.1 NADP-dependent 3-hydroxy acid dehydrogenase YdfG [Arcticibacter tournemirensis]
MENLNGKVILVTGGAQGLGKAICETLAEAGATVIIGDIQQGKAEETAGEIQSRNLKAVFKRLDLSEEKSVEDVIASIKSEYGSLDVLINNAGIDFTKPITELSVSEWDSAMKVNLRGPFLTAKFGLAVMAEQQSGYIINIISTAALRAWTEASVYHASKWGLRGFTQALFTEARKSNVKVTGLIAGGMRTPFLLDRFPDIDPSVLQDPANVAAQIKHLLLNDTDTIIPELMVIPFKETSWP